MICPVMSKADANTTKGLLGVSCLEEECAWWVSNGVTGGCAVKALAGEIQEARLSGFTVRNI